MHAWFKITINYHEADFCIVQYVVICVVVRGFPPKSRDRRAGGRSTRELKTQRRDSSCFSIVAVARRKFTNTKRFSKHLTQIFPSREGGVATDKIEWNCRKKLKNRVVKEWQKWQRRILCRWHHDDGKFFKNVNSTLFCASHRSSLRWDNWRLHINDKLGPRKHDCCQFWFNQILRCIFS